MEQVDTKFKLDRNGMKLFFLLFYVATFNSATIGYDSAMMNGLQMLPSYTEYFDLTVHTTALNVAMVFVGSVAATPVAGLLADKWGRKWGMAVTALISIIGATIQTAAVHVSMFCIGRFIVGFAVTTGSTAAPAYISETSHPKHRALLTGLYGAAWYVGGVMAAAITFGTQYLDSTWAWRAPSLLQFLPSCLCVIVLPFIPESPRWLVYNDRLDEARAIILKYHANGDTSSDILRVELEEIVDPGVRESRAEDKLQSARCKSAEQMAVWLRCCSCRGNNIISYYFGEVLTASGITGVETQLGINLGLSVFNLLCAVAGSVICEKIGRRPSFLGSTTFMAMMLLIVGILNKQYLNTGSQAGSAAQVAMIFVFYGAYSLVWTPLAYLYPLEVLSFSLRANGMASYNGMCYTAAFFNTFAIPYAMEWSSWGFYLISAGWCLVEVAIMWYYFPETKGMTLEEIDFVFDGETHADVDVQTVKVVGGEKDVVVRS